MVSRVIVSIDRYHGLFLGMTDLSGDINSVMDGLLDYSQKG